jgi:hypothetical protein
MKWITVEVERPDELNYPDECPNCLGTPADHTVSLKEESLFLVFLNLLALPHHIGGSVGDVIGWPHCADCTKILKERDKFKNRLDIGGLIIFAFITIGVVILYTNLNIRGPKVALYGLLFFAAVLIIMRLVYREYTARLPFASSAVKNGNAVIFKSMAGRIFANQQNRIMAFLNPQYAKLFIEQNQNHKPKYDERRLRDALEELSLQKPKQNRD